MLVTPTFPTVLLITLATVVMVLAAFGGHVSALAWSGAMLFGLAIARLLNRTTIARARSAGFEMLWKESERYVTCYRQSDLTVTAELRNRSGELLVLESIAPLSPSELRVTVEPPTAVLPAHSSMKVHLNVKPLRVGVYGIQGLTVVLRDDTAAFESQLTFANPFVVEVLPERMRLPKQPFRGGQGRYRALSTRTCPLSGDSLELRELRELQRGDELRKVAWKASARRGKLLVRDDEQEQHHSVHFVLDASVELWAGDMGKSALDVQIVRVASAIRYALRRGDRVGLTIMAARVLSETAPGAGKAHELKILSALAHACTTRDGDRASLDEQDVAAVILEHLRPVEPKYTRKLTAVDGDAIARLAQRHLLRAPFVKYPEPFAASPRERLMRHYLAAFGLPSPPRTTTDRDQTDRELIETLKRLLGSRPDRVVIFSPWPTPKLAQGIALLIRRLKKARIVLEWNPTDVTSGIPAPTGTTGPVVDQAVKWYAESAAEKGNLALQRLGVHTSRIPLLPQFLRIFE